MPNTPTVANQAPIPQDASPEASNTPDVAPQTPVAAADTSPTNDPSQAAIDPNTVPIYDISGTKPVLGSISPEEVTDAVASGKYSLPTTATVPVMSPDGVHGTLDPTEAPEAFRNGYKYATPGDIEAAQYTTPTQKLIAYAEGTGQGLAGPVSTAAERAFGIKPEDIQKRASYNALEHGSGYATGLIGPALLSLGSSAAARLGLQGAAELGTAVNAASKFTQAGIAEKAGAGVASALGLGAKGAGAASSIGGSIVKGATEMALLQAGDETTKMLVNDPESSAETAAANIGLASVFGGTVSGAFGAVSPLWKATVGPKLGQIFEDFKGSIQHNLENPEPVSALTAELENHYNAIQNAADEVYGSKGLKSQELQKVITPWAEMSTKEQAAVNGQMDVLGGKLNDTIDKMVQKEKSYPSRLVDKLISDREAFNSSLTAAKDAGDTAGMFNAVQDLKQTLQGYSKFEKFVKPVDEAYDFVKDAKSLAHDFRTSLEDTSVWGKAAERQAKVNKAFTDYLPSLKDFEKTFTTEVGGERQVDPGKVNTFLNQLGKPNAEIKQEKLKNFLDASQSYKKTIQDTHANLGVESPIPHTSLALSSRALEKPTLGQKLANAFVKDGLAHTAATGVGATAGHLIGLGAPIGALIGEHALTPFFKSVLPAITKPILEAAAGATNGAGVKAAVDYGVAVAKGEATANKAVKNVFKEGAEVVPESKMPTEKDRANLQKQLSMFKVDPNLLVSRFTDSSLTHYAPQHAQALSQTASNAVNYLNSIKPHADKANPLDSEPVLSSTQKAMYNQALNIAQNPNIVLQKLKQGSLTPIDVTHLKNLYPSYYNSLQAKLTHELIQHTDKGNTVPYASRLQLAMFLDRPLDSTMTPQAIMAAQPAPQQPNGAATPGKRGNTSKLDRLPSMYKTTTQASEEDNASRK